MDPREFNRLAQRLAAGSSPAEFRSAISRAYYAVFNVGAEVLRSLGFRVGRGAAAHGEVQFCLQNSGDPEVAAVASELRNLHSLRNRADYQLDRTDAETALIATSTVATASALIHTLD